MTMTTTATIMVGMTSTAMVVTKPQSPADAQPAQSQHDALVLVEAGRPRARGGL